jgi:hypothetical protein
MSITEIKAIASDVDDAVSNITEAMRDAQRGQNGLSMFDGLEDEDDKKIEHLQGCINDVTYELDNTRDKLRLIESALLKLVDDVEYENLIAKFQ